MVRRACKSAGAGACELFLLCISGGGLGMASVRREREKLVIKRFGSEANEDHEESSGSYARTDVSMVLP